MEIYPRGLVIDRAKKAVDAGLPVLEALPFPIGSPAGQLFVQEFQIAQAMRRATLPSPGTEAESCHAR